MNFFAAMRPNLVTPSVMKIPFRELKEEGKKCFLLDFDNTIGPDRAYEPNEYSFECIKAIKEHGFSICLVSNAKSSRSEGIARKLGVPTVTYAKKPKPTGVLKALKLMDAQPNEAVMVGDQVFTDIMAGNFAGTYTILVEKYQKKEKWYILIKRPLEKVIRFIYKF